MFVLEIHLPYCQLRDVELDDICQNRKYSQLMELGRNDHELWNISFYDSTQQKTRTQIVYQGQISLLIIGARHSHWTAYAFGRSIDHLLSEEIEIGRAHV